jgi:hypothetical protein
VGYTDRLVGKFLRRLHRTGLWNKALIVVTADHGISYRGGDLRRRPTRRNLAELAFTPLFVKLPGQQQGRIDDDRHVQTVDILPTIADVLGIKIPWHTDGTSALAGGPGSSRVDVASVTAPYTAALAQRRASLARQLDVLGSGSWGPQLAGTGRYRGLVGKPVASLQIVGSASGSATIDAIGSKLLRAFPKRSQLVPSPLTGPVSGLHTGDSIAFALDGRIAAVSVVYRGPRFSELVPESAFRPGRNSVRAFVVSGAPSAPQLRELRVRFS